MATRSRTTASSRPKTASRKAGSAQRQSVAKTQSVSEALVAARDRRERCARSEARRFHLAGSEANRGIAEALGGTQFAPQGRRLSLGALDADVLCQSCREDLAEDPARTAGARQGRTEAAVWEGVTVIALQCRPCVRAPDAAQRHKRVYARLRRAMALREAVRC